QPVELLESPVALSDDPTGVLRLRAGRALGTSEPLGRSEEAKNSKQDKRDDGSGAQGKSGEMGRIASRGLDAGDHRHGQEGGCEQADAPSGKTPRGGSRVPAGFE